METSLEFTRVLREWTEIFMRRSMRDFVQFSKESGLSMSQLSTLMRLYHAGPHGVSDLGGHLGVTNAAASQMIDRLVQQGLLLRAEDPRDRRMKNITLTPKGQTLIQQSIEARQRWMEDLTKALTPEEQDSIITALTILTGVARQLDREGYQPYCPPAENIVA